jgi:ribosomal peptide maturation radical SAM protein 1
MRLTIAPAPIDPAPVDRAARERRRGWPVALVSMPFMEVFRPSIQIGLLKEIATAHGFPARTLHANLDFAARIGIEQYRALTEQRGRQVGDWLFSVEAFGDAAPDPESLRVDEFAGGLGPLGGSRQQVRDRLLQIRHEEVPAYLDALVDAFPFDEARVVGFSSTFQQNTASFALARRLKRRRPETVALFGGANFDGEMGIEYVRTIECIDLAVIGEGDHAFPRLLVALADGADPGLVPGVARRVGDRVDVTPPAPPITRMDDLPTPDYREYFQHAQDLGVLSRSECRGIAIPFESARGCWWGEKHHCTFCGLNGTTMQFRSKSADRVAGELAAQARRYRSFRFESVDNILDMQYLKTLLPALVAEESSYELFYEVKANLSRAQLRLLAQSGIRRLQPGIESLSSHVLTLMRKGVRAAQNVNLLRWAQYYGIQVEWNLLWGFPGETADDYATQTAAVPDLVHLRPPSGASRIWLERFSPLFTETETFKLRYRTPERSYAYVYPKDVDLDRAAYFFDYDHDELLPEPVYAELSTAVDAWIDAWESPRRPVLRYRSAPGLIEIYDARRAGLEGTFTFEGPLADIYLACSDRPMHAAAVRDRLRLEMPVESVQEAFDEFRRRGLMFQDGTLAVSLALPTVEGR